MAYFMIKDIVSITHIENQRHSAHYETALIDIKNDACDLNPLIKFEEFIISGPVFQPSPHAGVLRLTLLLPDSTGSLSIGVGEDTQLLTPGELFCMNSGSGVVYEERVSSVNCYVHGISILLNTHSTLKKMSYRTEKFQYHPKRNNETLCIDGQKNGLGEFRLDIFTLTEIKKLGIESNERIFIYVLSGEIVTEFYGKKNRLSEKYFIALSHSSKSYFKIDTKKRAQVLILRAKEINEKSILLGYLAMNSQEQINSILEKYRNGNM